MDESTVLVAFKVSLPPLSAEQYIADALEETDLEYGGLGVHVTGFVVIPLEDLFNNSM